MKIDRSGFTLIEIMIVVVVIGILLAIAIPSYRDYIIRANRVDAKEAMLDIASNIERYYIMNRNATLANFSSISFGYGHAPGDNTKLVSKKGFYTISYTPVSGVSYGNAYTLTAIPIMSPQTGDTECTSFTINYLGVQGSTGTATTDRCWR